MAFLLLGLWIAMLIVYPLPTIGVLVVMFGGAFWLDARKKERVLEQERRQRQATVEGPVEDKTRIGSVAGTRWIGVHFTGDDAAARNQDD